MDVINASALAKMETFARGVLMLKPEKRDAYFASLVENGVVTQEESDGLAQYVMLYRIFTDQRYYKAIQNASFEMYMKTLEENEKSLKFSSEHNKDAENASMTWYASLFNPKIFKGNET